MRERSVHLPSGHFLLLGRTGPGQSPLSELLRGFQTGLVAAR